MRNTFVVYFGKSNLLCTALPHCTNVWSHMKVFFFCFLFEREREREREREMALQKMASWVKVSLGRVNASPPPPPTPPQRNPAHERVIYHRKLAVLGGICLPCSR